MERFGLDGGESLIPGMLAMIDTAAADGLEVSPLSFITSGVLQMMRYFVTLRSLERAFCSIKRGSMGRQMYFLGLEVSRQTVKVTPPLVE